MSAGSATVFGTTNKRKAEQFCSALIAAGLTHQRVFVRGSGIPENAFRISYRPATKRLAHRFLVRYRDLTKGPRLPHPAKVRNPRKKQPAGPCANAVNGCDRHRLYRDGFCKRCHDRHEYRTNPTLRARKIRQARERKADLRRARNAAKEAGK